MVESIDFDRFMMSKGTETFILAFTSTTGQFVAHIKQIQKITRDSTKRGEFSYIDFISAQPTQVLGNADLRFNRSRLRQMRVTSPPG